MFWWMHFTKTKVSVPHYKSMRVESIQESRLTDPVGPSGLSRSQILSTNNILNYI